MREGSFKYGGGAASDLVRSINWIIMQPNHFETEYSNASLPPGTVVLETRGTHHLPISRSFSIRAQRMIPMIHWYAIDPVFLSPIVNLARIGRHSGKGSTLA